MKHRELFLSRQVETLPATHIRGKCSVTLLNEEESLLSYLNKDVSVQYCLTFHRAVQSTSRFALHKLNFLRFFQDTFFYCLVFDPTQKTLLADKGEIRVGSRYQTELQHLLKEGETDERVIEELETLVWTPHHSLNDRKIDQFLVVSRSVGTFARALDCSSSVKQPSLHMSAAAASRDITLVSYHYHCIIIALCNHFNFSSTQWTHFTSTTTRSSRRCARWCRQAVLYCVATKWRNGAHRKRISSKRRSTNTAKTSTTSEMTL